MALFSSGSGNRKEDFQGDDNLKQELAELVASGEKRDVQKAITEAEQAVSEATKADIRGIKLLEKGRCPECSARTENLLYTSVCPNCGY